jgi:hypothetical protein
VIAALGAECGNGPMMTLSCCGMGSLTQVLCDLRAFLD